MANQQPSIALITTTINVPTVLALYAKLGPDVAMIVTGDKKTPHGEVREFLKAWPQVRYLDVEDQERLAYRSSPILGWNTIQRRNISLLEAIRSGAEVIVTIDDDNIPVGRDYFNDLRRIFGQGFDGLMADTAAGVFDIGQFLEPRVHHRGFPYDRRHKDLGLEMRAVTDAKVGVAAGLWLGDPDIDAMERITNAPIVHRLSEAARSGLVVRPGCMTPFNSQNTGFTRELAPAMMVLKGVGRYDDIWAAYIAGRIMRETGDHVHFGQPLVWQERNRQSLWTNLKDEVFGMEHTPRFIADLAAVDIGRGTIVDRLRRIYAGLAKLDYVPRLVIEQGQAWCEDVERVMA